MIDVGGALLLLAKPLPTRSGLSRSTSKQGDESDLSLSGCRAVQGIPGCAAKHFWKNNCECVCGVSGRFVRVDRLVQIESNQMRIDNR